MGIIKYYKHQGNIDEIASRYHAFAKLKNAQVKKASNRKWQDTGNGLISYQALTVFVGKTGYGKSSTFNAFFGNSIMRHLQNSTNSLN